MGSSRLSPFFAVNQRKGDGYAEQGHLPAHHGCHHRVAGSRNEALDPPLARNCSPLAGTAARHRRSLSRHQRDHAVAFQPARRLRREHLDDLPVGSGSWGPGQKGRTGNPRRQVRDLHSEGAGSRRQEHPVPEGLHRLQRRADRWPTRPLHKPGRNHSRGLHTAPRECRRLHWSNRCEDHLWRQARLLSSRSRRH